MLTICMAFLSGCEQKQEMVTSSLFAMDTVMELQILGNEKLLTQAEQKIRDLEKLLSVTDENSDITNLNNNSTCQISATTADIMSRALTMCDRTEGALDITVYPVLRAWGFTTGKYRVPTDEELQNLLKFVDYREVGLLGTGDNEGTNADDSIDSGKVSVLGGGNVCIASVPVGMKVDLGSVAKGYTSTMIADFFRENGVTNGLINLGGNVQCIGAKPNGEPWKVAIKSPFPDSSSGIYGVLAAEDTAIITSGGYERYFEEGGKTYWHIIDPSTGKPASSGLLSVTIVGKDGLTCDSLSTALFIKGLDESIKLWKNSDDFDAIFITEDGEVYITEGIADDFTLSSEYYKAPVHVVSK